MIKKQVELEDFITKVLSDIDKSAITTKSETSDDFTILHHHFDVEFDVAVTVSSDDKKGLGVSVASVFKADGSVSEASQSTTRIKFKIPVQIGKQGNIVNRKTVR